MVGMPSLEAISTAAAAVSLLRAMMMITSTPRAMRFSIWEFWTNSSLLASVKMMSTPSSFAFSAIMSRSRAQRSSERLRMETPMVILSLAARAGTTLPRKISRAVHSAMPSANRFIVCPPFHEVVLPSLHPTEPTPLRQDSPQAFTSLRDGPCGTVPCELSLPANSRTLVGARQRFQASRLRGPGADQVPLDPRPGPVRMLRRPDDGGVVHGVHPLGRGVDGLDGDPDRLLHRHPLGVEIQPEVLL